MMRYISVLVFVLPLSIFTLTSCSTPDSSDSDEVEDVTDAGTSDENVTEDTAGNEENSADEELSTEDEGDQQASNDADPGEDELEKELGDEVTDDQAANKAEEPDALEDDLSSDDMAPQPAQPAEPPVVSEPVPTPAPVVAEQKSSAKITDIRYVSNSKGGTVVIETSEPVTYQTRMNAESQQFVIEMQNVSLPAGLRRPYDLKEFNAPFASVNAFQNDDGNSARIVVELSQADAPHPIVQQEGTSLIVLPASAPEKTSIPMVQATTIQEAKPVEVQEAKPLSARNLVEFMNGNQAFYGKPISLQVKDADIRDLINFLAEESGANIVMSDEVRGSISLKLRRVPWDQALVLIMRMKDMGYVRQGNVLRITTINNLREESEKSKQLLETQTRLVPDVVQVIPVNYANLGEIQGTIQNFLTNTGRIVSDGRTSTLIVTDKPENLERVTKLMKTLDVPPGQVSIESKIVEAIEEFQNFIGVNWGFPGAPVRLSQGGGADGAPIDMTLGITSATLSNGFTGGSPLAASLNIGTLDILGDLTASLALAERDSLAKVISAPRISTMNKERSTITQAGENIAIIQQRSDQSTTVTKTEKRTPFALELSVMPQITSDNSVIIDMDVKREFLGATVDAELGSRPVNKRSAHTKILVRNGQTAVIGGIFTSDEVEAQAGVPGLKNLPLIGWLFKSKTFERSKTELLIFLTPRILAADNINQTAAN